MEQTEQLNEQFLDEYVSDDAVRKYTTETAGYGISYLLEHEYARIIWKQLTATCARRHSARFVCWSLVAAGG